MQGSLLVSGDSDFACGLQPCVNMHPDPEAKDLRLATCGTVLEVTLPKTHQMMSCHRWTHADMKMEVCCLQNTHCWCWADSWFQDKVRLKSLVTHTIIVLILNHLLNLLKLLLICVYLGEWLSPATDTVRLADSVRPRMAWLLPVQTGQVCSSCNKSIHCIEAVLLR